MDNWQPIETAPKDGSVILVCDIYDKKSTRNTGEAAFINGRWLVPDSYYDESFCNLAHNPTHWQPLPKPPVSL